MSKVSENLGVPELNWESTINVLPISTRTLSSEDESRSVVSNKTHSTECTEEEWSDTTTESHYSVDWGSDSTWPDVDIPGTWGTQGLEKIPFEDSQRSCTTFRKYEEIQLDEIESTGILTDRIIAASSSYLDRSPETEKYVLCKVNLSKKCLSDVAILTYHHYLQYVDLSWNELTDVEALGQLPFLMYLDVSHNFLKTVLDFKAPFNLTFVNYSFNGLQRIGDLTAFWSIVHLDLSNNRISVIEGLQNLNFLRHLNLSHNVITCIENLNHLKLITLLLQNNQITSFETGDDVGLKTLDNILWVNLKNNYLTTLTLFQGAENIQSINMGGNAIEDLMELTYLKGLNFLTEAKFKGNPIYDMNHYIEVCLHNIKHLYLLDGDIVSATNKVRVDNSFNPSPHMKSIQNSARLLFLQQINDPFIGNFIIPSDEPLPPIIVLVGPPGSNKGYTEKHFCLKNLKYTILGVSHTTRAKNQGDIEGKTYYFVSNKIFDEMMDRGEFITMSEVFGNKFGLAQTELSKTVGRSAVLILHMDLTGALTLRAKGYRCRLVLAMPNSVEVHKLWLAEKYFVQTPTRYPGSVKVENCPRKAKEFLSNTEYAPYSHAEMKANQVIDRLIARVISREECEEDISMDEESVEDESTKDTSSRTSGILKAVPSRVKSVNAIPQAKISFALERKVDSQHRDSTRSIVRMQSCRSVTFGSIVQAQQNAVHYSASESGIRESQSGNALLSVLSRSRLDKPKRVKVNSDTVTLQLKALDSIIEEIIKSRETYLDIHYSNSGLFSEVIFTNDSDDAFEKLKELLKECITYQPKAPQQHSFPIDNTYRSMVGTRLQSLHNEISSHMSVSQHQLDTMVRVATRQPLTSELKQSKKAVVENMRKYHHQAISYKFPTDKAQYNRRKSSEPDFDFQNTHIFDFY